MYKTHICISTK